MLFSYYSIKYSKDFRRDKEFNYGYTRLTIIATFVNAVYIIFEFLELIKDLTEGLSDHAHEDNPHDVDENYIYYGIRIFSVRIALLSILLFWTLKDVSLIRKIEDIIENNFPKYERIFSEGDEQIDEFKSDNTLRNWSLLYFSLKILIIYELLGDMSNIWTVLVSYHLGLLQHIAVVLRSVICLVLSFGPFFLSSFILLQKNSPKDKELESKIKNELMFIEGVIAVLKLNVWTIEGMQRVWNIHIKVLDRNYDEMQRSIHELLGTHFTRDSDLTVQLDVAGA
jgi:divalent metal cation (Fe/Co/Zn/Cd) transporter